MSEINKLRGLDEGKIDDAIEFFYRKYKFHNQFKILNYYIIFNKGKTYEEEYQFNYKEEKFFKIIHEEELYGLRYIKDSKYYNDYNIKLDSTSFGTLYLHCHETLDDNTEEFFTDLIKVYEIEKIKIELENELINNKTDKKKVSKI
jgi:hypothetical protein